MTMKKVKMLLINAILIISILNNAVAQTDMANISFSVSNNKASLAKTMTEINRQTGLQFAYSNSINPESIKLNLSCKQLTMKRFLEELSINQLLDYKIINKRICFTKKTIKATDNAVTTMNFTVSLNSQPYLSKEKNLLSQLQKNENSKVQTNQLINKIADNLKINYAKMIDSISLNLKSFYNRNIDSLAEAIKSQQALNISMTNLTDINKQQVSHEEILSDDYTIFDCSDNYKYFITSTSGVFATPIGVKIGVLGNIGAYCGIRYGRGEKVSQDSVDFGSIYQTNLFSFTAGFTKPIFIKNNFALYGFVGAGYAQWFKYRFSNWTKEGYELEGGFIMSYKRFVFNISANMLDGYKAYADKDFCFGFGYRF